MISFIAIIAYLIVVACFMNQSDKYYKFFKLALVEGSGKKEPSNPPTTWSGIWPTSFYTGLGFAFLCLSAYSLKC